MNCSLGVIQAALLISALRTVPVPTAANSKLLLSSVGAGLSPQRVGPLPASSAMPGYFLNFTISC